MRGRLGTALLAIGALVVASASSVFGADSGGVEGRSAKEDPAGGSIFQLDSVWLDQEGRKVSIPSLKAGEGPLVLAMLYMSCPAACPIAIADLKRIEKGLSENVRKQVRFVIFSIDPDRDKPVVLKEFMKKKDLDPARWTLLTAPDDRVREVAAVLGIRYKRLPENEFAHSNIISVLDRDGVIRHQQVGLRQDPAKTLEMLTALAVERKSGR